MIKNQKGNVLLVLLIIIMAVVVGVYLVGQKTNLFSKTGTNTLNSIQNDSELKGATAELDNTNMDAIDSELGQNDADLSSF